MHYLINSHTNVRLAVITPVDNIELKKKWPEVCKRWDCNQGLRDVQTFLSPLYHACSQERGVEPPWLARERPVGPWQLK